MNPSRSECLSIIDEAGMPANIRRHSLLVARVALVLARGLVDAGLTIDISLVEAASLLHDIGKATSLETKQDHAELGAAILIELGHNELAPIVRDHIGIKAFDEEQPLTESLVVNYADKRVKHDAVVSLEDRFSDLGGRYARSDEARARLRTMLGLYQLLEAKIFGLLKVAPEDVKDLTDSSHPF